MPDLVHYDVADHVVTVTLARPQKRNALNFDLVAQLKEALTRAADDDDVRVVVLTGSASTFSAGADLAVLRQMQSATAEENLRDSEHLAGLFEQIVLHPKPVIGKINGHAVGGGCGLAVVCDISIASEEAKLGFTEVRIGFVPAIVMVFVLRKVGEMVARDLLLSGRLFSAREGAELGLLTQAVPAEDLHDVVAEQARTVATKTSGSAVTLTKQMLARVPGMGLTEALGYAAQMNAFARGTADCRAGIQAFLDETDPPWRQR